MADNRQRPTETRASIEWLEALESDTYKRFSWEYFEKSEGDELKRLFTAGLSLSEAVSYAKGKNWLQGGLFYAPIGR